MNFLLRVRLTYIFIHLKEHILNNLHLNLSPFRARGSLYLFYLYASFALESHYASISFFSAYDSALYLHLITGFQLQIDHFTYLHKFNAFSNKFFHQYFTNHFCFSSYLFVSDLKTFFNFFFFHE